MSNVPLIPRRWNDVDISGIEGKKYFITGGTSGLGKASAAALIRRGAHVTITARTPEKGRHSSPNSVAKTLSMRS